jgi:uncharacterized protein YlxW (UPF0749 family)
VTDDGDSDALGPRLRAAMRSRPGRAQVDVAALCGLLAFGLVTQAHTTADVGTLASARPDDLVSILADLSGRADRLRAQVADLQRSESLLENGSTRDATALAQARLRAQTLGILTGTLAARGPGVVLTVTDPRGSVHADVVLDAIEELRDAGAEAMQIAGGGAQVRIVASTAVADASGGVTVDGTLLTAPLHLVAIGEPRTLSTALGIPGGVVDTVDSQAGAHAVVTRSPSVSVTALRALQPPRYASPAPASSPRTPPPEPAEEPA